MFRIDFGMLYGGIPQFRGMELQKKNHGQKNWTINFLVSKTTPAGPPKLPESSNVLA